MKRPTTFATAAALLALASSPALALQIYVSNEKDNTVTVIDGNTLQPSRPSRPRADPAASSPAPTARRSTSPPATATSWT